MEKTWKLRVELYKRLHNWPSLLVFILIGCIAGWTLTYFLPATYLAKAEIYVAINPYRTYSDAKFRALARPKYTNIDDYKNWQMAQLETAIFLDRILNSTLKDVKQKSTDWNTVSLADIREMITADWRSAGKWTLTVTHNRPDLANQLIASWSQISIQETKQAINSARNTFMIDQELQANAYEISTYNSKLETFIETRLKLRQQQHKLRKLQQNVAVDIYTHQLITGYVSQIAQFSPVWAEILQTQPTTHSLPETYIKWIDDVIVNIDNELDMMRSKISWLEQERERLSEQYATEANNSLGLSPNLEVSLIRLIPAYKERPVSTMAFLGGVVGLLSWLFFALVGISREKA